MRMAPSTTFQMRSCDIRSQFCEFHASSAAVQRAINVSTSILNDIYKCYNIFYHRIDINLEYYGHNLAHKYRLFIDFCKMI